MVDRRTRQGKRDLALLQLLGSAGLRGAEIITSWSPTSTTAPRRGSPSASGARPLDELVGQVRYRQARPHPRRAARRGGARGHRCLG
jgi:hypothetical protein